MSARLIIFSPSSIFGAYLLLRSLCSRSQCTGRQRRGRQRRLTEQLAHSGEPALLFGFRFARFFTALQEHWTVWGRIYFWFFYCYESSCFRTIAFRKPLWRLSLAHPHAVFWCGKSEDEAVFPNFRAMVCLWMDSILHFITVMSPVMLSVSMVVV